MNLRQLIWRRDVPLGVGNGADGEVGRAGPDRLGLALAAALFLVIFLLRLADSEPDHPLALLYAIPVLIVAIERGARAGIAAAAFAVALTLFWDLILSTEPSRSIGDHLIRVVVVVILGAAVGALASRFRASVDALQRFWNLSSDLLVVATPSGYFKRVSPSWTRTLGWSPEELRSRPFVDFVHPVDREQTELEFKRVMVTGRSSDFQNRYRRADGSYRTLQWRATADRPAGVIFATARDITARVEIEQRLQAAVETANDANAAKSEFLSRMSHELRTPLNAILGFAQLLEMAELEPRDREGVTQIREGGRHLLRLVDELLEISVIEAGEIVVSPEPVAAAELLDETLALVKPLAAEAEVDLIRGQTDPALVVRADRRHLKQVLLNLLSNAVKYSSRGGTVTAACGLVAPGRASFLVSDDGPGMSAEQLRAVFTPFERLGAKSTSISGTGLGLPISKRLVELMGGNLEPTSTPGVGTMMRIELASVTAMLVAKDGPAQATSEDSASVLRPRRRLQVVYVEDDDASTELVERALARDEGVELHAAATGGDGLELIRAGRPDLVLLDLDLPDIDGVEILERLKREPATSAIPVVVISADATKARRGRVLDEGARAFLSKPLEIAKLLDLVGEVRAGGAGDRGPSL